MITLYKKNTPNITTLLYRFHDCREIKISRKIGKKELRSIVNDVTKIMIDPIFVHSKCNRSPLFQNLNSNRL